MEMELEDKFYVSEINIYLWVTISLFFTSVSLFMPCFFQAQRCCLLGLHGNHYLFPTWNPRDLCLSLRLLLSSFS